MSDTVDEIILSRGGVVVSKALVRVGRDTYSVASIGSVFIRPPKRGFLIAAAVVFGLFAILLFAGDGVGAGIVMAVITALCILFAVLLPSKLMLRTASGDHPVLVNRDSRFLGEIKGAVEQALIRRA